MLNAGCGLLTPLKDQVEAKAAKAFQETWILSKLTMKSSHRSLHWSADNISIRYKLPDTSPSQTFFGSSRNPPSCVTRVRTKTTFIPYWWFSLSRHQKYKWKAFNIESLESGKWKKINIQKACQESGLCNMLGKTFYSNLALYGDAKFLCPFQVFQNKVAGNQKKDLFLSVPTYAWILRLKNS